MWWTRGWEGGRGRGQATGDRACAGVLPVRVGEDARVVPQQLDVPRPVAPLGVGLLAQVQDPAGQFGGRYAGHDRVELVQGTSCPRTRRRPRSGSSEPLSQPPRDHTTTGAGAVSEVSKRRGARAAAGAVANPGETGVGLAQPYAEPGGLLGAAALDAVHTRARQGVEPVPDAGQLVPGAPCPAARLVGDDERVHAAQRGVVVGRARPAVDGQVDPVPGQRERDQLVGTGRQMPEGGLDAVLHVCAQPGPWDGVGADRVPASRCTRTPRRGPGRCPRRCAGGRRGWATSRGRRVCRRASGTGPRHVR
ncbi:hypothetical protein SALBM311S_04587 [Streptomyces alboniger]